MNQTEKRKYNKAINFLKWASNRGWYKNNEFLSQTQIDQKIVDEANKALKDIKKSA